MRLVIEYSGPVEQSLEPNLARRGLEVLDTLTSRGGDRHVLVLDGDVQEAAEACAAAGVEAGVWGATEYTAEPVADGGAHDRVVVERRFVEPLAMDEVRDRERRNDWCLDMHGVRFLKSLRSTDGVRMLCIYGAADVESVRIAQRTISMPVERVWGEAPRSGATATRTAKDRLWIADTTLRDGITGRRIDATAKQRCFALIDALGVDVIEVGMTTATERTDDDLEGAIQCIERATVCVLSHPDARAIERAGHALAASERGRLHVYNAVADAKAAATNGKQTDLSDARLDEIGATVRRARDLCADVQWSALDATRAEPGFLGKAVEVAIEAGACIINLPDTRGRALPYEIETIFETLQGSVPEQSDLRWSAHCHNDLGLAVANALTAIGAGARQIECTIGGLGPHGGNTSLERLVAALRERADAFRLDCRVSLERCEEVCELLRGALAPS
jgi:hypothetical protein